MNVRALRAGDLDAVAALHVASFPKAAISRLGRDAARRFYESLLTGPHDAVALGAFEGSSLVGYCFVGVWRNAEAYFLRRNVAWIVGRVLARPWLAWSPLFRSRASTALRILNPRHRKSARARATDERLGRYFGIQSIAVDPAWQGKRVGRLLMDAAEGAARSRGFDRMGLSVHADNAAAIRLYERSGWERLLVDGAWHGVMVKSLS